ncbi:MAG: YggS family pyridoxal phosphate-dependent enzyme [Elusimicrobia bacterium]|nr:YggS family pyridoxal phosphate-dependent enzyme [Elusimicrobiota bacterium]
MISEKAIFDNWVSVKNRIDNACHRSGRKPQEVTLLGVTKTMPAEVIEAAFKAGLRDAGENRVQELLEKKPLLPCALRWHLIGHLQGNKAARAVELKCEVVQSVDTVELAGRLDRMCSTRGLKQGILMEINLGQEPQKYGFLPHQTAQAAVALAKFPNLLLRGLMGVVPLKSNPEESRPYYQEAARLMRDIGREIEEFRICSLGTSQDFEVAVEEGSTMVRLGRSIFGDRTSR